MKLELPPLPYAFDALEPLLSTEQVELHYEKHHRGYVDKLEKLIGDQPMAEWDLEAIVRNSSGSVFQNAAQIWNHAHYWQSMKPGGGGEPRPGLLAKAIVRDFGSFDAMHQQFADAAIEHFGSGWTWLVHDRDMDRLAVESTHDADTPVAIGQVPLLCLDVWEHAYYVDYRNERDRYVKGFFAGLVNWDFAEYTLRKNR